jgi:hypothetical protein
MNLSGTYEGEEIKQQGKIRGDRETNKTINFKEM